VYSRIGWPTAVTQYEVTGHENLAADSAKQKLVTVM